MYHFEQAANGAIIKGPWLIINSAGLNLRQESKLAKITKTMVFKGSKALCVLYTDAWRSITLSAAINAMHAQ